MPPTITANHRACAAILASGARRSAASYRAQADRVRVDRARAFCLRKADAMGRMAERYEAFADDGDPASVTPSYGDWLEVSALIAPEFGPAGVGPLRDVTRRRSRRRPSATPAPPARPRRRRPGDR